MDVSQWFSICCEAKTGGDGEIAKLETRSAAGNESDPFTAVLEGKMEEETNNCSVNGAAQAPESKSAETNLTKIEETNGTPRADPGQTQLLPMYTVTLNTSGAKSFGACFDITDPQRPVLVKIVPDSPLGQHISVNSPSRCPQIGSALVAVNNKVGKGSDMVRRLRISGPVSATFKAARITTVKIPEGEGSLGLEIVSATSPALGLIVKSSTGRAASAGVQARDFIVAVNGEKISATEMFDILRTSKHPELEIWSYNEEAQQRTITIPKGDGELGLDLLPISEGSTNGLQVVGVTGRAAEAGVRSMDIIVATNGVAKNPKELYEDLRQPCQLTLLISTPAS